MKIITKTAMANFSSVKYFREQKKNEQQKGDETTLEWYICWFCFL